MEKNFLRSHDLNKRVAEARKRDEYFKKKRTALYLCKRRVVYLLCRIDQTEIHLLMKSCSEQRIQTCWVRRRCFICLSSIHPPPHWSQRKEKGSMANAKMYTFLEHIIRVFLWLHKLAHRLTFVIIYFLKI